ncbi:histidine phosphatase family protein [Neobacillus sedimentimangrovi]|uniref:Histidine phosphatase family protein n=2 Tax=Neobacillus TaxID=2675232 RepID=A0A6B3TPH4_9BACI|nr:MULTISPECIES: histidine phosphatase family protein [Neobacillus]AIM15578.1 phosphoglycerate mutase [Bacillus sp. X1(2014)]MCD4838204.1 histidine phosphatase family protein [Neobacillus sedimentimangrovi]MED3624646.1 histidine phosphatase family protein [Neobacillus thermocopriae]MED3715657.1 histidine phosphatase family protein [Neobacillus thermocopriae]NEX78713.1 histidine phosphatase family protein [Neobacillus thermocopriae]
MKKIYVVRHCEAVGQSPDAQLTDKGLKQAFELCEFFSNIKIDQIIASPYRRAIESIQPLAKRLGLEVEIDRRLTERILSTKNLSDWFEKLRSTFEDIELKFEGGESSREAMNRIVEVVDEIFSRNNDHTVVVTHGNLMSLLFMFYSKDFGFDNWKSLSNPDVFLLIKEGNQVTFKRIWK